MMVTYTVVFICPAVVQERFLDMSLCGTADPFPLLIFPKKEKLADLMYVTQLAHPFRKVINKIYFVFNLTKNIPQLLIKRLI